MNEWKDKRSTLLSISIWYLLEEESHFKGHLYQPNQRSILLMFQLILINLRKPSKITKKIIKQGSSRSEKCLYHTGII